MQLQKKLRARLSYAPDSAALLSGASTIVNDVLRSCIAGFSKNALRVRRPFSLKFLGRGGGKKNYMGLTAQGNEETDFYAKLTTRTS